MVTALTGFVALIGDAGLPMPMVQRVSITHAEASTLFWINLAMGARWSNAADIVRLLTPTILVFAVVNPFACVMIASGRASRCLWIAIVVTPVLLLAYLLGLRHGMAGLAVGFSAAMLVSSVPVAWWARHGTSITMRDIAVAVAPGAISTTAGALAASAAGASIAGLHPAFVRLAAACRGFFGCYLFTVLCVMRQKTVYVELLNHTGLSWRARARADASGAPKGAGVMP